jgi:hypothetical protein
MGGGSFATPYLSSQHPRWCHPQRLLHQLTEGGSNPVPSILLDRPMTTRLGNPNEITARDSKHLDDQTVRGFLVHGASLTRPSV